MVGLMPQRRDVSIDSAASASVNHGCRPGFLGLPAEQLREKRSGLDAITASDFEMHHWLAHLSSIFN
jgi:hypothetical protein